jgi:hypothetical protein
MCHLHFRCSSLFSQMRDVRQTEELDIPSGIDVTIKSRVITVSGPRGTLTKSVQHVEMDIQVIKGKTTKVSLTVWQGGRKHVACLRTIRSMINNMVIGVTKVSLLLEGFPPCFTLCRASDTKCVPSSPTSLSTASFRRTALPSKSGTFWVKRYVPLCCAGHR